LGLLIVLGVLVAILAVAIAVERTRRSARRRIDRELVVGDLRRRYVVWLPVGHREKQPLPVVLAFHGGFGAPESMEESAAIHEAVEAQNFVVVYPEGFQRSWNAELCCGPAMEQKIDDGKFVRTLLDDLAAVVKIDGRRIYATGFSNGALLTYYLASTMADRIAAIAPVGGAMQNSDPWPLPARPVPVFHWHGLVDRVAPYAGGKPVIETAPRQPPVEKGIDFWRRFAAASDVHRERLCDGAVECIVYSGGPSGARVQLCRVAGLGHQWPGSRPKGNYAKVAGSFGPLGPPIDANDMILKFFREFALPTLRIDLPAKRTAAS
jgi:polyhydroxybutyrate depolymerase